ncbi:MAG: tetratricopeptide repeat protein, partial [Nitrospiria bacterium]
MWAFRERSYSIAHPPDYAEVIAKRPPAPPYPPRTADHQAAVHFAFAYALSTVGRVSEGEEQIKRGLAIPGISKGYQHLFLFELALHSRTRGNTDEAIALAQKAIQLIPEHHRPWEFLADTYRSSFIRGWE